METLQTVIGSTNELFVRFEQKENPWLVLVVNDEPKTNENLTSILTAINYDNEDVHVTCVYDHSDAISYISNISDLAIVIIKTDEHDDGVGLDLVRKIREIEQNGKVRILLLVRNEEGLPGDQVFEFYQIDNYITLPLHPRKIQQDIRNCLQTIQNKHALRKGQVDLDLLIEAHRDLSAKETTKELVESIIDLFASLLLMEDGLVARGEPIENLSALAAQDYTDTSFQILVGTGKFHSQENKKLGDVLEPNYLKKIKGAIGKEESTIVESEHASTYIGLFKSRYFQLILILVGHHKMRKAELDVLRFFEASIAPLLDKMILQEAQQGVVYGLKDLIEIVIHDTGHHVSRVARMSWTLGRLYGLNEADCKTLSYAAALHDLPKLSIPAAILNKPERLTEPEFEAVKKHTDTAIFRQIIKTMPDLANAIDIVISQHHEKWNGTGYPKHLSGEAIHIYAQIVAILDALDAMLNKRIYSEIETVEYVIAELTEKKGIHFAPKAVDLVLANFMTFVEIARSKE
jgi:response regulator RpfG family c-di-GMP phosphodiesterase